LREIGATEAADKLRCLSDLFEELKNEELENVSKSASHLELPPSQHSFLLGDIAKALAGLIALAKASGVTKTRIDSLVGALTCVSSEKLEKAAFSDFVEALKASFDIDVVALHLNALESSLGTPEFDAVFSALENDRRIKKPELAAIASRFISRTSKSAPKGETMKRIYARHASLVDSANKREWQKGKSAA
jgi:hypothetical protein